MAHDIPRMVASGVNRWSEIVPNFDTTFENIDTLLVAGRKFHALGLVNTVWTDDGQILMQMSWPGMAYGAAASWQSRPLDRFDFFSEYSRVIYSSAAAPEISQAFMELNAAEQSVQAALGRQTMSAMWTDPFIPPMMDKAKDHREDLRECQLHAERAEEDIYRAQSSCATSGDLQSLLLGAQMLDYTGMKYLYALEIADSWATLPAHPTRQQITDVLRQGISSQVHSRTADLMDEIALCCGNRTNAPG